VRLIFVKWRYLSNQQSESHDFGTIRFVSMRRIEWYQNHMILIVGSIDIVSASN